MYHPEFFRRAFIPLGVLCLLAFFVFLGARTELRGLPPRDLFARALPFVFTLFGLAMICCLVTSFLLGWGEYGREGAGGIIFVTTVYNFVFALTLVHWAADNPTGACLVYAPSKVVSLLLYLAAGNFGASFARILPELQQRWDEVRQEQERRLKAAAEQASEQAAKAAPLAARVRVEQVYQQVQKAIVHVVPPELFQTELRAAVPEGADEKAANEGARDLIKMLQQIAEKERQRQEAASMQKKERKQRVAELRSQIKEQEEHIARLRKSDLPPDTVADEIHQRDRVIRQLQQQIELFTETKSEGSIA